jgi:hypothetical protein
MVGTALMVLYSFIDPINPIIPKIFTARSFETGLLRGASLFFAAFIANYQPSTPCARGNPGPPMIWRTKEQQKVCCSLSLFPDFPV